MSLDRLASTLLDELEDELRLLGLEMESAVVREIDSRGITFEGDLRKSVTSEVAREVDRLRLTVAATAGHAIFVHEGTRPHWPPPEPIERWVRAKLGITEPREIRQTAFLVSRKISRVGTRPNRFLTETFQVFRPVIIKRLADRATGAIRAEA